jgi:hypothetical protein
MSWFSFSDKKQNKAQDTVEVQVNYATPKPKTKGMLWVETSSEEVYYQTLTNMWEEVKAMNGFPSKTDAHNAGVLAGIILRKLQKLDRTRMTTEQKSNLAGIVFKSFPEAVAQMETHLADIDEAEYAVETFGETLRDLMARHIDRMPRRIPVPNQLSAVSNETAKRAVETVGSKESDEKLSSVKALAAEAYKLATSTEDRFFAEQAANSYIPDSVRMLAGLIHAPEDMKQEANELFMKQLEIIEAQLNGVVRRSANNSLSALKAHTEFLESKDGSNKSRLELE